MSGYMGPKKSKAELFLKLLKRVQRPEYTVHILENREGQKAMFYNYKGESFDEGDCVKLKATIADHRISSYDGSELTYLNRVILENKGSVKKEKKIKLNIDMDEIIDNLLDRRESHKKQVIKKLSNLRDRAQPKKQLEQTKAYGQEKEIGETFA